MSATLPIPFAVGAEVWSTGSKHREEWVTCPECCGTRVITMRLGNGEEYEIDCACCGAGYEPSRGAIRRTVYERAPERFTCRRVLIYGDSITYTEAPEGATAYTTADAADLFEDEETCRVRCEELNAESRKRQDEQAHAHLMSRRRDMAHSVHYWRRKRADLVKDLGWVEAKLRDLKALSARAGSGGAK